MLAIKLRATLPRESPMSKIMTRVPAARHHFADADVPWLLKDIEESRRKATTYQCDALVRQDKVARRKSRGRFTSKHLCLQLLGRLFQQPKLVLQRSLVCYDQRFSRRATHFCTSLFTQSNKRNWPCSHATTNLPFITRFASQPE